VYASRSMVRIMISLLVRGRRPAHLTLAEAPVKRSADGDSSAPKRKRLRRDKKRDATTAAASSSSTIAQPVASGDNVDVDDDVDNSQPSRKRATTSLAKRRQQGVLTSNSPAPLSGAAPTRRNVPLQNSRQPLTS